ncbi:hypothetical protein BDQ17DRAFT_1356988 [Cyathus striatus]|nr:hypothetical protein BDQ17DRAFT_1356988 [Cyathus striatus]
MPPGAVLTTQDQVVQAARYISAAGVTALLWDHLITIDDELSFIWQNERVGFFGYASKTVFAFSRYGCELAMIYGAYAFSGISPKFDLAICRSYLWVLVGAATSFASITHFIILLQVYVSWDRRRSVAYVLMISFAVVIPLFTVLLFIVAHQAEAQVNISGGVCIIKRLPHLVPVAFGCLLLIDFLFLVLIVYNAVETPHRNNIDVIHRLQKDGFKAFLVLFILRLINFVSSLAADPAYCLIMASTVLSISMAINGRMHLRLEEVRLYRIHGISREDEDRMLTRREMFMSWS